MPSAPEFVRRRVFTEVEEMAAHLQGFDIDLMQLEAGVFSGEHLVAGTGRVLLQGGRTGPALLQRGTSPSHPTFCIRTERGRGMTVNGREIAEDAVSILQPGQEFTIHTGEGFPISTVSVEESHLRSTAREIGLEGAVASALRRHRVAPPGDAMRLLRHEWRRLSLAANGPGTPAVVKQRRDEFDTGLVRVLVRALATEDCPSGIYAVRSLDRVVKGVESALDKRPRHAYSVRDLAIAVGVGERTLRRAMRAWYRAPTVAVVRTRRLRGARRELLAARPGRNSVTSIAMAWGFDHLGRFAGDYRALFAELPSETLRRVVDCSPGPRSWERPGHDLGALPCP
jgi:AraC family ethanolamine operon transcriptional activator